MRAVVQRVKRAQVSVDGRVWGRIGAGLLVLLAVAAPDTEREALEMATRIVQMRIFADSAGKMNLDLKAAGGELLVVSQFTLLADTGGGRRPSFSAAAGREQALALYQVVLSHCRAMGFNVQEGAFGAHMEVELLNDGPVTMVIECGAQGRVPAQA